MSMKTAGVAMMHDVAQYNTDSPEETMAVGHSLALLLPPKMILLRGDLGAGKTTLVKGIAQAMGVATPDEVTSPTFTLVHEFGDKLYHLDLYRLEHERELLALGLEELEESGRLVLVEWGEKFPSLRHRAWGEIFIDTEADTQRRITVTKF
jgi:tRNA threonylcarbamoyladenosine biosynthesis protein TsaE